MSFNLLQAFPLEINEMIFQHLNVSDLLQLSQLSSEYTFFIENNKNLMRKVAFNIDKQSPLDELKEVLVSSTRCYRHLKITQFPHQISPTLQIIQPHLISLTSIRLFKTDFDNFDDFIDLMLQIEATIKEIHLEQVYIKIFQHKKCLMKFLNLKEFTAICCQASIFHEVFINCENLTKFCIKSGNLISSFAHRAILKILANNQKLKILGIHFDVFNLLFCDDIASSMGFKLNEFHANDISRILASQLHVELNFKSFLFHQLESLKALTISNWLGINILNLIYHVPQLRTLSMRGFHHCEMTIDWIKVELHANASIEVLRLHDLSMNDEILRTAVKAARNLRELTLYSLSDDGLNFIAANCEKIELINVEVLRGNFEANENFQLVRKIK